MNSFVLVGLMVSMGGGVWGGPTECANAERSFDSSNRRISGSSGLSRVVASVTFV